eukprot:9206338-Alexandrium_andersonii.AAC.1
MRNPGTCGLRAGTARPPDRARRAPSIQALLGPATREVNASELLFKPDVIGGSRVRRPRAGAPAI